MSTSAQLPRFALLGAIAVLVPILIFGSASWRAPRSPEEHAWDRWVALGPERQRDRVQQFHKLMARGDSAELLRRAGAFAALPAEQQRALVELDALRHVCLAKLTPAERIYVQELAPEARAFEILRRLRSQDPETLPESARALLARQ